MATLYITEFSHLAPTATPGNDAAPAPVVPGTAEQSIAITAGSVASAAFNANTKMIMVQPDAICSLAFSTSGSAATAVNTAHRVAANETRFYGVTPGGKVSVITNV